MELPARTHLESPGVVWLSVLRHLGVQQQQEAVDGTEGAMGHMPELARVLVPAPAITFQFSSGMKWVAGRKVRHQAAVGSDMQKPPHIYTGSRTGACLG